MLQKISGKPMDSSNIHNIDFTESFTFTIHILYVMCISFVLNDSGVKTIFTEIANLVETGSSTVAGA